MRRPERALLLTTPDLDHAKQERVLFEWAREHRYYVTSLAATPEDARSLAVDGLIEVVVLVAHTKATLDVADAIIFAGVRIDELRPRPLAVHHITRTHQQVLDATKFGIDPETIAKILGIPLSTVQAALAMPGKPTVITSSAHTPGRRPQEVTRPAGRR